MTTKKSKKDILLDLNRKLHDELTTARAYHHAALYALRIRDKPTETYCEDARDAHRHTAFVLVSILRKKQRIPKDILWMATNYRVSE